MEYPVTQPSLISARPWNDEDARAGMLDRAISVRGSIGGHAVALLPEPLLATVDGEKTQSIRLVFDDAETLALAGETARVEAGGNAIGREIRAAGPTALRVLVSAVTDATVVTVAIPSLGTETIEIELVPQREWTVHVVHHSHFDFGYTDPQAQVFAAQRSYLDSAVELIEQTADWPEESRFRWNSEALWAVVDWEKHRPRAQVEKFIELVKAGSIGLSALPYNLHTDVCSTDELRELLRDARRLRDQYGIQLASAMQTDVPGQVAGLPDALADLGVRYLSVAHNWAGRSEPHTNGAINLPRMFRWRSLAGKEVLVWMTDSPHGLAYMEGPMLGFTEDYDAVEHYLPAYLTAMATRGYPFPPGVFGAHGESMEGRDPYPWDILHLRTQGYMGDNGPARGRLSEIVREWNETWDAPKLRVSRNEDFFEDAEQRLGDELITVEGDWGDWWVEGVGSAAVPIALMREAQAGVTDARTLSQLSAWLGGQAVADENADANSTYDAISMFNEHTWGAGNSWMHGDSGFSSGELQWQWKVAQSLIAQQRASDSVEESLAYLAEAVAPAEGAAVSFVVANPTGIVRSGAVRFLLPEVSVGFERAIALVDARTGAELPFAVEAQENHAHRESGRWITARIADVPSFGVVRIDVLDRGDRAGLGADAGEDSEYGLLSMADPGRSESGNLPDVTRSELLTLQNEYLRVVVDEHRSAIASIVELATGRELVRADSVVGFNGYVYDEYASSGAGFNHLANKLAVSDRLELLATRTVGKPSRIVERTDDDIESRLVYEFQAAGADWVRVTLRLRTGEPRLLIENRLSKPSTLIKESAYFAFPFSGDDARLRYEVSGSVTGDGLPHIPGAPQHMRAVRDWVTVSTDDGVAAWVTRDAPLIEPHTIAVPYSPFPSSTSPAEAGTIYSWLHNNLWDTNFPIEQAFEASFHYAVGVAGEPGQSAESVALSTAADLVHPLRAVRARGGVELDEGAVGLLALSDARVQLVSVLADDDGSGSLIRVQSFADEPIVVDLALGRAAITAAKATYLGDDLETLEAGDTIALPLERFEATAVHVTF